jgi:hypothetical protein
MLSLPLSCSFSIYCLLLGACGEGRHHSFPDRTDGKPLLTAEPNPVPAGDPDQALATTVITWSTGDEATGDLYVKVNRSPEFRLARARSGTLKIDWIQFDSTYEFRLYTGKKRSKLRAKLDVTRNN